MGRNLNNWTSAHIKLLLWIKLNITNLQTRAIKESRKVRVIKHHLSIVLTGFACLFRIRRQFPFYHRFLEAQRPIIITRLDSWGYSLCGPKGLF